MVTKFVIDTMLFRLAYGLLLLKCYDRKMVKLPGCSSIGTSLCSWPTKKKDEDRKLQKRKGFLKDRQAVKKKKRNSNEPLLPSERERENEKEKEKEMEITKATNLSSNMQEGQDSDMFEFLNFDNEPQKEIK